MRSSLASKVSYVVTMTKPAQLALLAFTAFTSYFAAGGPPSPTKLLLLAVVSFFSIGGITALNMVLESDLDSIMNRTKSRPLPSGKLTKAEGLTASLIMILIGFAAAALINLYVLLANVLAFVFDIPLYTILLKRRSPLNVVLGGVAGVMPALGGWAAGAGSFGLGGIILAIEVLAWIPVHIWYIVYYYEDDYRRAKVPMLPVVSRPSIVAALSTLSLSILVAGSWAYWVVTGKGLIGALASVPLAALAAHYIWTFAKIREKGSIDRALARKIFMLANPILVLLFIFSPFKLPAAPRLAVAGGP